MPATRVLLTSVFGATACVSGFSLSPGPVKFYDGPVQVADSLALVENDRNMFLESLNGRSLRRWNQTREVVRIYVRPGRHSLVAGPSERAGVRSTDGVRFSFVAKAGHRYVVSRRISGGSASGVWEPILTDVTTGQQLVR